ncbi:hypothetical protein EES39_39925 [Streptomyces sp. ADI92-24]|nr:hypothetical protein EES39_39925 [Streptomyces sp. ADI92-24]
MCGEWKSTRVWPPFAYIVCAARSATLRWVTATPFGTPVEPDVNITYSHWSGWAGSAGGVDGRWAKSAVPSSTTVSAAVRATTG